MLGIADSLVGQSQEPSATGRQWGFTVAGTCLNGMPQEPLSFNYRVGDDPPATGHHSSDARPSTSQAAPRVLEERSNSLSLLLVSCYLERAFSGDLADRQGTP